MRKITDFMESVGSMFPTNQTTVSEGRLTDGLKKIGVEIKKKFRQVVQLFSGWVARFGRSSYWLAIGEDGEPLTAITPLTAGQAYKDGEIDKETTFVQLDGNSARALGFKTDRKEAKKLYGKGNSLDYWREMVKESTAYGEPIDQINEVKMENEDPEAVYNVLDTADLEAEIASVLKRGSKATPLLIFGAPGIGKTAILDSVLNTLPDGKDWSLITKTLSNETPENFTLPKYVEVDGQTKATDIPKTWMPVYKPTGDAAKDEELDEKCGKGLLFIDELSRASAQVLNVILPLVNERRMNDYKLGSGWVIICASNRPEDELSGQTNIGNALANRFEIVYYEPTVKSWSKWANTQGYMSPLLTQWLSMAESENLGGGKFFYFDPNEDGEYDSPTALMCTPRSWTNAMRRLATYAETGTLEGFTIFDVPRQKIAMTLNKYVPRVAVDSFLAFLDTVGKIGDFDKAVEAVWKNGGQGLKVSKKDLQLISIPLAQLIVSSKAGELPTEEEYASLVDWLISTGSDQLTSYIMDIIQTMYAGDLDESLRPYFFVLRSTYDKATPVKKQALEGKFKPMLDKLKVNIADFPDYSASQKNLGAKFKDVFASAKVGDLEGL